MAGIDESVDLDDYINLVKILTLTAWDFLTGPE
jgi:succinyl-diaminopimelate desuccinylase